MINQHISSNPEQEPIGGQQDIPGFAPQQSSETLDKIQSALQAAQEASAKLAAATHDASLALEKYATEASATAQHPQGYAGALSGHLQGSSQPSVTPEPEPAMPSPSSTGQVYFTTTISNVDLSRPAEQVATPTPAAPIAVPPAPTLIEGIPPVIPPALTPTPVEPTPAPVVEPFAASPVPTPITSIPPVIPPTQIPVADPTLPSTSAPTFVEATPLVVPPVTTNAAPLALSPTQDSRGLDALGGGVHPSALDPLAPSGFFAEGASNLDGAQDFSALIAEKPLTPKLPYYIYIIIGCLVAAATSVLVFFVPASETLETSAMFLPFVIVGAVLFLTGVFMTFPVWSVSRSRTLDKNGLFTRAFLRAALSTILVMFLWFEAIIISDLFRLGQLSL